MSGKPRFKLGGWLKAIGLSAIVAAYAGVFSWSAVMLLWVRDVPDRDTCPLILACVSVLAFFVALLVWSREVGTWWRRQTRARRVSVFLFWGTLLLCGLSRMWLWGGLGRFGGGVHNASVLVVWHEETSASGDYRDDEWFASSVFWKPVILHYGRVDNHSTWPGGQITALAMPLWVIGVAALWPWWTPWLLWLLGGRVRGHAPLRSWNCRLALVAVLLSTFLYGLSHQSLTVWYGSSSRLGLVFGRLFWRHDTLETNYAWPPSWGAGEGGQPWTLAYWAKPRGPSVWQVEIPLWIPTTVCYLWLILAVRPRHWFRRRWENGLCLHCGYDLRGLKERCTECGQPIEPERLAQLARDGGQPETETPGGDIELHTPGGEEEP